MPQRAVTQGVKNTLVVGLEKEKYIVMFNNILHVIYFIILFDSTDIFTLIHMKNIMF